jgi:outer membrane protein
LGLRTSWISIGICWAALGQSTVDLAEAVRKVSDHYPSVKSAEEQVAAAAAGIQLARTAYLPHVDLTLGVDRATHNNAFTLLLPSQAIAPISGPVLNSSLTNVWGSTAGALVTWEPFDLGSRRANTAAAEAGRARAQASVARTQFEMGTLAADAFLTVLAAQETVRAAQAGVTRNSALRKQIDALVGSGLRPGVEATRAEAEQAAARIQLTRAHTALAQAGAALAQLLAGPVELRAGKLLTVPPIIVFDGKGLNTSPMALEQQAVVNEADAKTRAIEKSYVPKFLLQGTVYGRGTGARPDGTSGGAVSGLAPNIGNWGIGFTVLFPLFDLPAVRAKEAAQSSLLRSESSRYDQVMVELAGRRNQAIAAVAGAREVAVETPVQVRAAQEALKQSLARYESGLNTFIDVADAQRSLTQAEIDDALARLNVWRCLLALAAVQGDLSPVIAEAVK